MKKVEKKVEWKDTLLPKLFWVIALGTGVFLVATQLNSPDWALIVTGILFGIFEYIMGMGYGTFFQAKYSKRD